LVQVARRCGFNPRWRAKPAAESSLLKLRAVPFTDVKITDSFWSPRQETNRVASIPINFQNLEKAGNLQNFRLAAQRATNGYQGPVFMDSDAYKALEAAAYSLATHPDLVLEKKLDEIIATLAAAQLPDGYLNTFFIVKRPDRRWKNLRDAHELYCAGHLIEAPSRIIKPPASAGSSTSRASSPTTLTSCSVRRPSAWAIPVIPNSNWRSSSSGGDGRVPVFRVVALFRRKPRPGYFADEHKTARKKTDDSYWAKSPRIPLTGRMTCRSSTTTASRATPCVRPTSCRHDGCRRGNRRRAFAQDA